MLLSSFNRHFEIIPLLKNIEKKMDTRLRSVKKNDHRFLYSLLKERDSRINISHKKIPPYTQHVKFVMSKPYFRWYIVYHKNKKVGSTYLTRQNEIGINLKRGINEKVRHNALELLIKMNPRQRYLSNVSPRNKNGIKFLKNHGFKLIQYTYELVSDVV